jgi:Family of unknown function (DUF6505)
MIKLLRCIRFDGTDPRVFDVAAEPGEWACSGAFAFAHLDAPPTGKLKQAFANGFLGLTSFGRSTFATVGEATPAEYASAEQALAKQLFAFYGAPTAEDAVRAAREELAFVADLCGAVPLNTVFTVRRLFDAVGRLKEEFRQISPPSGEAAHARVWTIEGDETDETDERPNGT